MNPWSVLVLLGLLILSIFGLYLIEDELPNSTIDLDIAGVISDNPKFMEGELP